MISLSHKPHSGPCRDWRAGLVFFRHKHGFPFRFHRLAKIVKIAKYLHEPIEHSCLHTQVSDRLTRISFDSQMVNR
jgi:hypothetical protein